MGPHERKPWETAALEMLTFHWGDAYGIANPVPGTWVAQRRDNRATLKADSAEELFRVIHEDYERCPVPRDVP